jgi:K+-transporting ATPase KdpF subunit
MLRDSGECHERSTFHPHHHRILRGRLALHQGLRETLTFGQENFMSLDYALGGLLAVALAVYLVYALVKPERF